MEVLLFVLMDSSSASTVTRCAHEGEGAYVVEGSLWKVGTRYELIRVIGKGSFSVVCLARDKKTQELVAMKKIQDVFVHKTNAKNVIREVYIQRRLRHPNVVELKDLFMMPSPTGRWKMVKGKLVTDSVDLYLVLEYTDGGDLFHMSEQLNSQEVRHILFQLLLATQFLHSCGIIHRDIKSANILIKTNPKTGSKTIKLGDFGCARTEGLSPRMRRSRSYEMIDEEQEMRDGGESGNGAPETPTSSSGGVTRTEYNQDVHAAQRMTPTHDDVGGITAMGTDSSEEDMSLLQVQEMKLEHISAAEDSSSYEDAAGGHHSGHRAIMTTAVATPCYRAPEVVMSLESYTSNIDIWSLGCIFAELLARQLSHSKGYCKHLRVVPLFNLTHQPRVMSGANWDDGEGNTMAHRELRTVFEVIGTPPWALVERILNERWRKFLQCLPGHAPTLMRRFPGISEKCLDLLKRMLEFDSRIRCSATEAMQHEYFTKIHRKANNQGGGSPRSSGLKVHEMYDVEEDIYGEINMFHSKDKEAFNKFEVELEAIMLKNDEDTGLRLILENEISEHQRNEQVWRPMESPQTIRRVRLDLFKSFEPVLDQVDKEGENAASNHFFGGSKQHNKTNLLAAGRHRDWTTASSCSVEPPHWSRSKQAEPVWGVSTSIPGMGNKESNEIVSNQQSR